MSESFKMHVPFHAAYRSMVPEVVTRYAELLGGSSADAAALASVVVSAIERLGVGAGPDALIDLAFHPSAASVHVDVGCNGQHETVHVPIPPVAS